MSIIFKAGREVIVGSTRLSQFKKISHGLSPLSRKLSQNTFTVQDTKDFNERVKNSKKPVIVDFFASWCNPCRTLTPRIESVINENDGKVLLAKVDIDENSDLAMDYEVMSVPMLMAVENGKVVDKIVGLQDVDKLRKFVRQVVKEESAK